LTFAPVKSAVINLLSPTDSAKLTGRCARATVTAVCAWPPVGALNVASVLSVPSLSVVTV
jgi:hypothetical protein